MNSSILSKVKRGIIHRPQRIGLYGVESVGKTTLAAKARNPLILDVEGGSSHIDVPRIEVSKWTEIEASLKELQVPGHGFETIIIDSMDWAEKLAIDDMLARDKKSSVEDYGYGKGYTQAAERISRFLGSLDLLIEAGLTVILIAHAKVTRHEPPDGMQAYDRYELKMTRQTSPLVKEWCDSLLFANFKTRIVESEGGRAKGIGGKERVIYTHRSAAYDAKCRVPGIPEEIPMTWESVLPVISPNGAPAPAPRREPEAKPGNDTLQDVLGSREDSVNAFLTEREVIPAGKTWRDAPSDYLSRIEGNSAKFLATLEAWEATK